VALVAIDDQRSSCGCRLTFFTEEYFAALKSETFFPHVDITFTVKAGQHYHVPLLISPYGFSTYRGS